MRPRTCHLRRRSILAKVLGVTRAGYGTINKRAETITIERDWNAPGVQSLAGVLHFRDYGSYIEELKRGETVVISDARSDPRTANTAEALQSIGAQAFVNMPVTEDGETVALLYLNNSTPREWSAEDLSFVREVAQRARMVVARRQAEEELARTGDLIGRSGGAANSGVGQFLAQLERPSSRGDAGRRISGRSAHRR